MFRQVMSRGYWWLVGAVHHLVGTHLYEKKWGAYIRSKDIMMEGIKHPHRLWLFEQINSFYPFSSILEIGCSYGPNVQILAKKFPCVDVVGLDISQSSVNEGNSRLSQQGLDNASLVHGKADELSRFDDKSIDIVFTDATLLYVGPDKIRRVIKEMKRISRKALVLLEFHHISLRWDSMGIGVHTRDGWVRDYRKLLNHFFNNDTITLTKIPTDVWPTGRWPVYGYLITVRC